MSTSLQNYGRYYWEITVHSTHGTDDCLGLLVMPQGTFNSMLNGSNCAVVYTNGVIWSLGNTQKTLGPIVSGDVVSVAVDLVDQNEILGGTIWFRKNGGHWNGDILADPFTGEGGAPMLGFNNSRSWVPAVGFGGQGSQPGDSMTATFDQSAYLYEAPDGYGIWSAIFDNTVQVLTPSPVDPDDDEIHAPFVDLRLKVLYHPEGYVLDTVENIFPTTSFGGTLLLFADSLVDDAFAVERFHAPGYLATLDGVPSASVTVSSNKLTATLTSATGNVGARSTAQKNTGKWYFEVTYGQRTGNGNAVGILMENGTYTNLVTNLSNCTMVTTDTIGRIYSNNGQSGKSLGTPVAGDVIGIAVDLIARRAWFRRNGGLWNGDVAANPLSNDNGVLIASLASFSPAVGFGGGSSGDGTTVNFGQSAFINPAPTGFDRWSGTTTSLYLAPELVPDNAEEDIKPVNVTPANLFGSFVDDEADTENVFLISGAGGVPTLGPQQAVADDPEAEEIHPATIFNLLATFDGVLSAGVTLSPDKLTATHSSTVQHSARAARRSRAAGSSTSKSR